MKLLWLIFPLLLVNAETTFAISTSQVIYGNNGVIIANNLGTINLEGRELHIGINEGLVNIIGKPEDKRQIKDYATKVVNLEAQINRHLVAIQAQEERRFSDQEKLQTSTAYVASLLKQIEQLEKRIALLDEQHALTRKIQKAKDAYDVPLIKQWLKEKQQLDHHQAAETDFELAGFQKIDLEYSEAYVNYKKAVSLQPDDTLYLNQAGVMAALLSQYDQAIQYYEQALASNLKSFGEEHPHVARGRNNLGSAWQAKGEYGKAIGYFERALASSLKTFGEQHPHVAIGRNNLGSAWHAKGEYDKALRYFEQALASDLKTLGEEHPRVAIERNNLGSAWQAKGEYGKAIGYFEQALASNVKTFGEEHPHVARDRNNLGSAWYEKGEYGKALEYIEQALASDVKTFGEQHPRVATDRNNLGLAWQAKGEYDKAIGYYEQALKALQFSLGPNHPSTQIVKQNLLSARKAKDESN